MGEKEGMEAAVVVVVEAGELPVTIRQGIRIPVTLVTQMEVAEVAEVGRVIAVLAVGIMEVTDLLVEKEFLLLNLR